MVKDAYKLLEENILENGNRPIFFIGSGMSIRYLNGPNWLELLNKLIVNIDNDKPIEYYLQKYNNNYEQIANNLSEIYFEQAWKNKNYKKYSRQYYMPNKFKKDIFFKDEIKNYFIKLLDELSDNNDEKSEIRLLSRTNPTAIITTNYDELLEKKVFKNLKPIVGQKIITQRIKDRNKNILKIHGCVTKPESIVITDEDYDEFINNQKYLSAKLLTYFIEYTIIIMGYSLSDRNILGILETISDINLIKNNKINNIWFINYSLNNFEDINVLLEKEISLSNNKVIRINYVNVRGYKQLYRSIIKTDKYPYSLTQIANELGYNHWKSIEKYLKAIEKEEGYSVIDNKDYAYLINDLKRYSDKFLKRMKDEKNKEIYK